MPWILSNRADPFAREIADRHYNRQKVGAPQFVPPGRCHVLTAVTTTGRALWVSSAPFAEFVKHAWAGAWMCTAFRNEGAGLSSELIRAAVAATLSLALSPPVGIEPWGPPPALGFMTFVDASKVRRKRDPGRCYLRAGWERVGTTRGGLVALQLRPEDFPPPEAPRGTQASLWGAA